MNNQIKNIDFKSWIGVVFILGLFAYMLYGKLHYKIIKGNLKYKYTLARAIDDCVINASLGIKFEYLYGGKKYVFCSIEPEFENYSIGDKVLVRIYDDDPSAYDLLKNDVRNLELPPEYSWDSIP